MFKFFTDDDVIYYLSLRKNIGKQNNETFVDLCKYGKLESAKWLFRKIVVNFSYNNCECIRVCCENNQLDIIRWMYPLHYWILDIGSNFNDQFVNEDFLCYCCRYGYLDVIRLIHEIDNSLNLSIRNEEPVTLACQEGHLEVVKWLLETRPQIDISIESERAFRLTCMKGHLNVIKWLEKNCQIDISISNDWPFQIVCYNGRIDIAKWFFKIKPDIIHSEYFEDVFCSICSKGDFKMVKFLLKLKPNIDFTRALDSTYTSEHLEIMKWLIGRNLNFKNSCDMENFTLLCACGNLELLKWYARLISNAFPMNVYEDAFSLSCTNCHLEISKWLLEIEPFIDFCYDEHCIFKNVCENSENLFEDIEMIEWLVSLKPDIYKVVIENGKVEEFWVENKLEIIGEKNVLEIQSCIICQDMKSNLLTCCKHQYCRDCIGKWYKKHNTCPTCRKKDIKFYEII